MNAKHAAGSDRPKEEADLDGRYGEIGISAVAAALRYKCDAKNPAYAPTAPKDDEQQAKRSEPVAA
jgi:hypothetical protein